MNPPAAPLNISSIVSKFLLCVLFSISALLLLLCLFVSESLEFDSTAGVLSMRLGSIKSCSLNLHCPIISL